MTTASVEQGWIEPGDYRRTSYEIWEAMAPGWERWRAQLEEEALAPVRAWLINELAPRPGDTVLELGAGAGTPASRRPRSSASVAACFRPTSPREWLRLPAAGAASWASRTSTTG